MRCVGYRQAWEFLDGAIDAPALRADAASPRRASSQAPAHLAARDAGDARSSPTRAATSPAPSRRGSRVAGAATDAACCRAIIAGSVAPDVRACGRGMTMARTLYDKLWDSHVVREEADGTALLYIDRHLVHEVTSPQAYEGLKLAGRKPWRVGSIVATADHNTPTKDWDRGIDGSRSRARRSRRSTPTSASTAPRRTSRSSTAARASST